MSMYTSVGRSTFHDGRVKGPTAEPADGGPMPRNSGEPRPVDDEFPALRNPTKISPSTQGAYQVV
jgi:hypothetical protein